MMSQKSEAPKMMGELKKTPPKKMCSSRIGFLGMSLSAESAGFHSSSMTDI